MTQIAGNYREQRTWKTSLLTLLLDPAPKTERASLKFLPIVPSFSFSGSHHLDHITNLPQ
jgi:hypothetical protein